jgi:RNA polymerase sigma-70 factor (ECF subfamily)
MPEVSEEDLEIIEMTLAEATEAFGELVEKYQGRLYNSIVQIFGQRDAEDIVQEAFVKAFQKLDTFKRTSSFYTWLYRIAFNTAVSHFRKQPAAKSIDELQEAIGDQLTDDGDQPDAHMKTEERNKQIQRALDLLREDHRTILILREVEAMSYETLADLFNVPVGTIRSRLHRARMCLRDVSSHILETDAQ